LLAGLAGWAFVALAASASRRPAPVAAAGAVAFAALAAHASVDYVLHFPAVPLAAAALLGVASARARRLPCCISRCPEPLFPVGRATSG
jgi:hypothetical protein